MGGGFWFSLPSKPFFPPDSKSAQCYHSPNASNMITRKLPERVVVFPPLALAPRVAAAAFPSILVEVVVWKVDAHPWVRRQLPSPRVGVGLPDISPPFRHTQAHGPYPPEGLRHRRPGAVACPPSCT